MESRYEVLPLPMAGRFAVADMQMQAVIESGLSLESATSIADELNALGFFICGACGAETLMTDRYCPGCGIHA